MLRAHIRVLPTLVLLLSLGWTASARGDVVGPPAEDCPSYAEGDTCHGGQFCAPDRCTEDSNCDEGQTCQELELCIGRIDCAGGHMPDGGPAWVDTVEGSCPGGSACDEGTCQTVRVCVGESSETSGCGCRASGMRGIGGASAIALFAALLVLGLRRARRR